MMNNDMEITVTGHSKSAQKTLHYINYGTYNDDYSVHLNQPHANNNGIKKRNFLLAGINCHSSYRRALKDFNVYLSKKPKNKVQTLNIVLSFGHRLDWRKPEDRFEGYVLARKFVGKAFPNHQVIIAEQMDGKRMMSHIHLICNAISMKAPYNTIPGGRSKEWYKHHPNAKYRPVSYGIVHLRHIGQQCLNEINKNDRGFTHHIQSLTNQRGEDKYSSLAYYQRYTLDALVDVMSNINTTKPSDVRKALEPYGVHASFKRPRSKRRRRRGKRRRRSRYKNGGLVLRVDTEKGHVIPYQSGLKKARDVHRHYIKTSVLARVQPFISYKNIKRTLEANKSISKKLNKESRRAKSSLASKRLIEGSPELDSMFKSLDDSRSASSSYSASVSASMNMSASASSSLASSSASASSLPDNDPDGFFSSILDEEDSSKSASLSVSASASVSNSISVRASSLSVAYTISTSSRIYNGRATKPSVKAKPTSKRPSGSSANFQPFGQTEAQSYMQAQNKPVLKTLDISKIMNGLSTNKARVGFYNQLSYTIPLRSYDTESANKGDEIIMKKASPSKPDKKTSDNFFKRATLESQAASKGFSNNVKFQASKMFLEFDNLIKEKKREAKEWLAKHHIKINVPFKDSSAVVKMKKNYDKIIGNARDNVGIHDYGAYVNKLIKSKKSIKDKANLLRAYKIKHPRSAKLWHRYIQQILIEQRRNNERGISRGRGGHERE